MDVRTFRSRSNRKSPRIPRAYTIVAISGGVTTSQFAFLNDGDDSSRVEKQAVQEFQGQQFVNLPGVISISFEVPSH